MIERICLAAVKLAQMPARKCHPSVAVEGLLVLIWHNLWVRSLILVQRKLTESTYFDRVLCRLRWSVLKAVVKNVLKSSILILCWNFSACQSTDSLTMFNYGKIPNPGATAPSDPL